MDLYNLGFAAGILFSIIFMVIGYALRESILYLHKSAEEGE